MYLLIDLGNSRCKWTLQSDCSIAAGVAADEAELLTQWASLPIPTGIFACAVGALHLQVAMKQLAHDYWGLPIRWLQVERSALGLYNRYDDPNQLGPDRWAAAQGAYHLFPSKTLIIVSAGTAMVIDALTKDNQYWGGMILPGYRLMRESLWHHTARLSLDEGKVVDCPSNTADAIETGCIAGLTGAISCLRNTLSRRGMHADLLILSGGDAVRVLPYLDMPSQYVDNLVLEGLATLARKRETSFQ